MMWVGEGGTVIQSGGWTVLIHPGLRSPCRSSRSWGSTSERMGRTKNKKDIKQAVVGRARKGDNEIEVVRRLFPGEGCLGSGGGREAGQTRC